MKKRCRVAAFLLAMAMAITSSNAADDDLGAVFVTDDQWRTRNMMGMRNMRWMRMDMGVSRSKGTKRMSKSRSKNSKR